MVGECITSGCMGSDVVYTVGVVVVGLIIAAVCYEYRVDRFSGKESVEGTRRRKRYDYDEIVDAVWDIIKERCDMKRKLKIKVSK